MRVARPVVLSSDQQEILESRARARSAPARSVERARIVLLAGAGLQDQQIAAKLKITPEKAARWRNRFLDGGLPRWTKMRRAREERQRSHRPRCKR
jgi:transposase